MTRKKQNARVKTYANKGALALAASASAKESAALGLKIKGLKAAASSEDDELQQKKKGAVTQGRAGDPLKRPALF
jgi:hypothetical protein